MGPTQRAVIELLEAERRSTPRFSDPAWLSAREIAERLGIRDKDAHRIAKRLADLGHIEYRLISRHVWDHWRDGSAIERPVRCYRAHAAP